jgi:hypothetical protein
MIGERRVTGNARNPRERPADAASPVDGRETEGPPMTAIPTADANAVESGDEAGAREMPSGAALPRRVRRAGSSTKPGAAADPDDGTLDRLLTGLRDI